MARRTHELVDLLEQFGALRVREHPELAWAIRRGVGDGRLVRILPGVVGDSRRQDDPDVRIAAACLWRPQGILLGRAAARVSFDRAIQVDVVEIAGEWCTAPPGFQVVERRVSPDVVRQRGPLRFTDPSLTVVDLLRVGDRAPLYDALRRRRVTLASLRQVLAVTSGRPGNETVRRELWSARQSPWSAGEAELHQFLWAAGIHGWRGNARVEVDGIVYYADALFGRERRVLELDGVDHHTALLDREYDYRRRAALLAAGYRVMGLTLGMIRTDAGRTARRVVAARAITKSSRSPVATRG